MRALAVAVVYFGSFLAIAAVASRLAGRMMSRGLDLRGIQHDLEPRRETRQMFLLGAWRSESSDT